MLLEVRDDLLSPLPFIGDDLSVPLLEGLVLRLRLFSDQLPLANQLLGLLSLLVKGLHLVVVQFCLQLKLGQMLVGLTQLLKHSLNVELVELVDFGLGL